MGSKNKKGQAAITDLFIAIAIFIVLITITTIMWHLYNLRFDARIDYDTMVLKTYQIVDTMVKSPGFPDNWEQDTANVVAIGLASGDRILSKEKVSAFDKMSSDDMDNVKEIMHIALYDYYFVLKDPETNQVVVSAGSAPRGKFTVNLGRLVMYNNKPHILEFAVWM